MASSRQEKKTERPSFFKVMLGDFKSTLRIPPSFTKHIKGIGRSILLSSSGRRWRVKIENFDGSCCFQRGWEDFVQIQTINEGDFLVFHLDGEVGFDVVIYGKNGCEKDAIASPSKEQERGLGAKKSLSAVEPNKAPRDLGKGNKRLIWMKRPVNKLEREGILDLARSFKPSHPHFMALCRSSRLNHMTIPKRFATKYNLVEKGSVVLQGPTGGSWPVKVTFQKDKRIDLSSGWSEFVKGNRLGEGDVCVFELLQEGQEWNAHIFRVKEGTLGPPGMPGESPIPDDAERVLDAASLVAPGTMQFVSIWKPTCLYHVQVPKVHARVHDLAKKDKMILRDPCGRSWPVIVCKRTRGRIDLGPGWKNFWKANHLLEGDKCIFTFLADDVLQVDISRLKAQSISVNAIQEQSPD